MTSALEIVIAFIMAACTVWASNKALRTLLSKHESGEPLNIVGEESTEHSTATAIVFGAIVVGASLIAVQAAQVIGTTLNALNDDIPTAIAYSVGFAAFAVVIALVSVAVAARLTMSVTTHDESEAIAKNGVGTAVALGAVILAVSIFVAPSVRGLLVNLIPYKTTVVDQIMPGE
jgi:hypothetical protein